MSKQPIGGYVPTDTSAVRAYLKSVLPTLEHLANRPGSTSDDRNIYRSIRALISVSEGVL